VVPFFLPIGVKLPVLLDVSLQSASVTLNMSEALPPKDAARFLLDVLRKQGYRIYEVPEYIGIMKDRLRE
jgi:hypothetical protein